MSRIEGTGPLGSGVNEMKVNREGEALTFAVSEQEVEHVSETLGLSFNWSSDIVASVGAAGTVLLLQNTSKTHDLHIEHIGIANGVTDSEVTIHVIKGATTPSGTTAITGFNLNTGSSNVAEAVAVTRDTANATQGTVIGTEWMAADSNVDVDVRGLILTTDSAVGVDHIAGSSETAITIVGFYKLKIG